MKKEYVWAVEDIYESVSEWEKDFSKAVYWYQKAAEAGDSGAQNNLAICYEEGAGVEKNLETAIAYYRKAAKLGDKFAKEKLMKLEQNK